MNLYQETLFKDLSSLITMEDSPFYIKDNVVDGITYRVFTYRLASYSDFLLPSALECRGHMFEIDSSGNPVRLVSLPFKKFFNLNENPFTMNLDLTQTKYISLKMDGSLITTYLHNGDIRLKSKTSTDSEFSVAAMKILNSVENKKLKEELLFLVDQDISVSMEYTSPEHRIVLPYEYPDLTILGIRLHEDGKHLYKEDMYGFPEVCKKWVKLFEPGEVSSLLSLLGDTKGIEGFVFIVGDQYVKIKTPSYSALHKLKDSINSPRRLFECVVEETSDDLKAMFFDDPIAIGKIKEMEDKVVHAFNHIIHTVNTFYELHKDKERKDFAILGQKELDKFTFPLAMNLYLGKETNYKEYFKKHYKYFGIKDEEVKEDE